MGELNIPPAETIALKVIDADALRDHIDHCLLGVASENGK